MTSLLCFVASSCAASLAMAQGVVFQVNPAGPIFEIQTAVNMAVDGDLIEVAPGDYPAFSINGKHIGVVGIDPTTNTPATFSVVGSLGAPAIQINSLTPNQLVTISGVRIDHANSLAPAISIANNPAGNVRLFDVVVTTATALGSVPYDGIIEVANTRSVWLHSVRAGDHRVFGIGTSGTGLAALFCDATLLHLNQCDFRGLRSLSAGMAGGDGLRIVGTGATTWMVDTVLYGGMSLGGAAPNTLGGHPIHDYGGRAGSITACDCTLTPAVNTVSQFAIAGVASILAVCLDESIGRTSLTPATSAVSMGSSTTVTVSANIANRLFVLVIGEGFDHLEVPGLFTGAFLFGGNSISLASGLLGVAPFVYPLNLPYVPAAIGMHLTLQSGLLDPSGLLSTWSMSTAASFTVR